MNRSAVSYACAKVNMYKCNRLKHTRTKSTRTTEPVKSILHTLVVEAYAEVNGQDIKVRLEIPASDKCFKSVSLETYLVKISAGLSVPKTFQTVINPERINS